MNARLEDALDIKGWAKWKPDGLEIDWSTLILVDQYPLRPDGYTEVVVSLGGRAMTERTAYKRDGDHYICDDCAARYGAEWPAGHRGTAHLGDCDYCGHREKMLTAITDWTWPEREP